MTVTTSAAIAAISAIQSSRRVGQCKDLFQDFNAQQATVGEMQEYAQCVQTLYPAAISPDVEIALKVLFVVALFGAVLSAREEVRFGDRIVAGMIGFILWPFAFIAVAGLVYGIRWLFS